MERLAAGYAEKLLVPWVKGLVLFTFAGLFALFAYGTSWQRLEFDFTSVLQDDSRIASFTEALVGYSQRQGPSPCVYFRFVD